MSRNYLDQATLIGINQQLSKLKERIIGLELNLEHATSRIRLLEMKVVDLELDQPPVPPTSDSPDENH